MVRDDLESTVGIVAGKLLNFFGKIGTKLLRALIGTRSFENQTTALKCRKNPFLQEPQRVYT